MTNQNREYQLIFKEGPPIKNNIGKIQWLRQKAFKAKLIGYDPSKYPAPYGNISMRLNETNPGNIRFIVTGRRTGRLEKLASKHYAVVEYYPKKRLFVAEGSTEPASEYLMHGTVYNQDNSINVVFHSHCPEIWNAAKELNIPTTRKDFLNKTPEMAEDIIRIFKETNVREKHIFAMLGHPDGVVSFGKTPEEAWSVMHHYLLKSKK